ncbi:hypothetical protein LCGC14_2121060, partial [marine sediment metagenome]
CAKSAEYARGGDKLYNFYRAAVIDNISPIEALRGMHLKHRTSILDMLDDLEQGKGHTQELWSEKLADSINYHFLLWALLAERYGWDMPPINIDKILQGDRKVCLVCLCDMFEVQGSVEGRETGIYICGVHGLPKGDINEVYDQRFTGVGL